MFRKSLHNYNLIFEFTTLTLINNDGSGPAVLLTRYAPDEA
jgi:hypothetical protein